MRVLVVNVGSSSLKHAVVDATTATILRRGVERWEPHGRPGSHAAALERTLATAGGETDAVGHRVVHGGTRFTGPTIIDAEVRAALAELAPLAPLHTRAALEGIDAARAALPALPHVASFDTAFHRTLPPEAATYALPREWNERYGLRRYGFHGLNVQWCHERAHDLLGPTAISRLVVCHLGSGCSVTAVHDGRSVDTTMGLTPLDGVPMATRPGALDPGLLLYLLDQGIDPTELGDVLNLRSGLLGLTGLPGGVRAVSQAADGGDHDARLALEVLVRGISAAVAAMTTALGGLDTLAFSGGAGEGSATLRTAITGRLGHLGVELDADGNDAAVPDIDVASARSAVRTLIIAAGEEIVIARQVHDVLDAA